VGDKGGKKNKEKSQKQKTVKHAHEIQQKKGKELKNSFEVKNSNFPRTGL
jgi:hypothetical protein